jgi:transcriptional regulator of heat shock response
MKRLLAFITVAAIMGMISLGALAAAPAKPNPFAKFDKKIQELEEKIGGLDEESDKDKKKIEGFQKQLEKERDGKDKALQRMLDPFEKRLEKLELQKEKLEEQERPTDKIDQEIKVVNDKMAEIESLARPAGKDEEKDEEATVGDATEKGKNALKEQMD